MLGVDDDKERQTNEIVALESIYGDRQFISSNEKNGGQLSIFVSVPKDFIITALTGEKDSIQSEQTVPGDSMKPVMKELLIHYLPPIILNFTFPESYPSKSPPSYTLSCKWLNSTKITQLCELLDAAWVDEGPGNEVMFEWVQLLSQDLFELLIILSPYQLSMIPLQYRRQSSQERAKVVIDKRAHQDIASVEALMTYLIDYDLKATEEVFLTTYFNCGVCFCEKLGKNCVSFPKCCHVYCTECMTDYFKIQIEDGSVRALTCPEDKCESQADPSLVKRLVPDDVFEKYDRFLLQSTLECMNEIIYCPRTSCQSPVLKEKDESMGRCPVCDFVFCSLCKRSYHGVAGCPISSTEMLKLRSQYLNATVEEKEYLEKRYGKKKLQLAVEEHYSEAWLDTFSKKCPSCGTHIQKIDGCNKMTCFKCRKNFCWLCSKILSNGDPYDHFNDLKNGCFNKLFEGVVIDDIDSDEEEDGWVNLVGRVN